MDVYKRSYKLAVEIHNWSLKLPRELQFDLGSQMRRCSRSIPSNIAEGLGKNASKNDKINFLKISLGSNDEILFNLNFVSDVGLMDKASFEHYANEYVIVGKELSGLILSTSN